MIQETSMLRDNPNKKTLIDIPYILSTYNPSYPTLIKHTQTLKSYMEPSFSGRCSRSILGRIIGLMTIRERYVEGIIQTRKPS